MVERMEWSWLSGWWNEVIWWMVDGVVERMMEWGC